MAVPIYHAQSDIEKLMPDVEFRDAATTPVVITASDITATELNSIMLQSEAELKFKLGAYYYMNITLTNALGTDSIYLMNKISSYMSAQSCLDILRKSNMIVVDDDESKREENFGMKASRLIAGIVLFALKGYVKGAIPLTDATAKAGKKPSIGYDIMKTPVNKKGVQRY